MPWTCNVWVSTMEDILVRYENNCIIIWSQKFKSYFCTTSEENESKLKNFLTGNSVDEDFARQCFELGLSGSRRELHSQNPQGLMAPLEYYFDFTAACNLRCTHCYNRFNTGSTTMSHQQIEQIITDMYNSGVMRLHLAGGEPTLFLSHMETYLKTAHKYGIMTSMASNGMFVTDALCEILSRYNIFSITISIESADEEKNAAIRGAGTLAKSIDGIKKLIAYKKAHNATYLVGIKVSYNTSFNEKNFEDLIKLAIELDINVIKFANPERCLFHEQGYYSATAEKYYQNIETVQKLIKKYGRLINITQISSPVNGCLTIGLPGTRGCIGAQELIAIAPNGKITPCLMNDYDLGNIRDYKSITELYRSAKIAQYYEQIRNYDCSGCAFHGQCRGGCQVRKRVEHGKILNKDPLCPLRYRPNLCRSNKIDKTKAFHRICVLHSI